MRQRRRSNEHAENHLSPSGEHLPQGAGVPLFSKENAMFDINFIRYDADHS